MLLMTGCATFEVEHQPEVFAGPCRDMFAVGDTPARCERAVIDGAQQYLEQSPER